MKRCVQFYRIVSTVFNLVTLGERSGLPDQSVPRTDKHCETINSNLYVPRYAR